MALRFTVGRGQIHANLVAEHIFRASHRTASANPPEPTPSRRNTFRKALLTLPSTDSRLCRPNRCKIVKFQPLTLDSWIAGDSWILCHEFFLFLKSPQLRNPELQSSIQSLWRHHLQTYAIAYSGAREYAYIRIYEHIYILLYDIVRVYTYKYIYIPNRFTIFHSFT